MARGRGARWSRSSRCPSCSRSRQTESPAPAPVAQRAQSPSGACSKALAKVKLGDTTRRATARRSTSFDPSNPFRPPKKVASRRPPGRDRDRRARTAAQPARRHDTGYAVTPAAAPADRRRRPAAATPAAATPAAASPPPTTDGLQLRRRRDLHGERPQAPHQGHGEARHAAEPVSPLLIFLGVTRQGPATRSSSWTRRSRPPARASASRARPSAPSLHRRRLRVRCSPTTTATPTPLRIDEIRKVKVGAGPPPRSQGRRLARRTPRLGPQPPLRASAVADVVVGGQRHRLRVQTTDTESR